MENYVIERTKEQIALKNSKITKAYTKFYDKKHNTWCGLLRGILTNTYVIGGKLELCNN